MKHLLTTIPKSRFKTWELAERVLKRCDGETDWDEVDGTDDQGNAWLWFIRTSRLPKVTGDGQLCFMIYDGRIRGYFSVISSGSAYEWIKRGYLLEDKTSPYAVVLANWRSLPAAEQEEYKGFQGWRYTDLQP